MEQTPEQQFRSFIRDVLFEDETEAFKPDDRSILIQQYQIARSSITDLQTDRNDQTRIYAVFLAALTAGYAYAFENTTDEPRWWIAMAAFGVIGLLVSWLWRAHVIEIGLAMRVRYSILRSIETYMPAKIFEADRQARLEGRKLFTGGRRSAAELVKTLPSISFWFFALLFAFPLIHWGVERASV